MHPYLSADIAAAHVADLVREAAATCCCVRGRPAPGRRPGPRHRAAGDRRAAPRHRADDAGLLPRLTRPSRGQ